MNKRVTKKRIITKTRTGAKTRTRTGGTRNSLLLRSHCKSKYTIKRRHPKYEELREKFNALCDLTTLHELPDSIKNLTALQKRVLGLILGNAEYTRKVMQTLALMTGITVTSDLTYSEENQDNDLDEILSGTNLDKPFAIPIALPNHINIVIVHTIDNVAHIEHFEPNGPHLTRYEGAIEQECRAIVQNAYPDMQIEYHAPNNICVPRPTSPRRMQSRIDINYKHSGSCSIFAMWYMFNRIIFLDRESAQETFNRMDSIIKQNPKYVSKLLYGFISTLSSEFPNLLIEIIQSAHSNYDAYVNFGKDIFNDNHKQILYNHAVENNNMKLFNTLYNSGYTYPEFDDDLAEWYSNTQKKVFKKLYDDRNPNSPLQSASSEEDEYDAPNSESESESD
jgi:hypothetical protein